MARRIDEVEYIVFAIIGLIVQPDRPGFDGDAALPFQLHGVKDLILHLPLVNGVAFLQQPVGQGGFAMVDVGHNGEVADFA